MHVGLLHHRLAQVCADALQLNRALRAVLGFRSTGENTRRQLVCDTHSHAPTCTCTRRRNAWEDARVPDQGLSDACLYPACTGRKPGVANGHYWSLVGLRDLEHFQDRIFCPHSVQFVRVIV